MSNELLQTALAAAEAGAEVVRGYFRAADLEVREKAANDFVTAADTGSERAILEVVRGRFPDHRILAEEGGGAEECGKGSSGGASRRNEVEWIIDPLDGTTNFARGLPMFAISVACRRGGEMQVGVILEPLRREVFRGRRGGGAEWNGRPMRVSGAAGLAGAFLATGYPFKAHRALDAYLGVFREVFLQARAIRRCGAAALDLAYTAAGVFDGFFEFRLAPWDLAAGTLLLEEAGGRVSDLDGGTRSLETGNIVAGNEAVQRELRHIVAAIVDEAALDRLDPRPPAAAPDPSV
ncbi:MAG: inositol monophosphatase family protein [Acidobacteriota bacterium]